MSNIVRTIALVLCLVWAGCDSTRPDQGEPSYDFALDLFTELDSRTIPPPDKNGEIPSGNDDGAPLRVDSTNPLPKITACGIYLVDSKGGIYRDSQIRDYPFIDGYVLRPMWNTMEPTEDAFDFAAIDHNLGKLDALDQKLSINFGAHNAHEPQYVTSKATTTWLFVDKNPNHSTCKSGCLRPTPWDEYAMQRFEKFVNALANHKASYKGQLFRLAEHPMLSSLSLGVVGLGSIRDLGGKVSEFPGYSREKLKKSVIRSLKVQTDQFPQKSIFVGFWIVQDGERSPELWDDLRKAILEEFDGVRNPKVGFWMENLSHSKTSSNDEYRPTANFSAPLYQSRNDTPIYFQALTSWHRPFTGQKNVEGGNPVSAMQWALQTFGTRYFEMYAADADATAKSEQPWQKDWQKFHDTLCKKPK